MDPEARQAFAAARLQGEPLPPFRATLVPAPLVVRRYERPASWDGSIAEDGMHFALKRDAGFSLSVS
jgi:hypothetical protein